MAGFVEDVYIKQKNVYMQISVILKVCKWVSVTSNAVTLIIEVKSLPEVAEQWWFWDQRLMHDLCPNPNTSRKEETTWA